MPRPLKCRRICRLPKVTELVPGPCAGRGTVTLAVDEYEVIRQMDYLGLTQEECARQLGVARTTVQAIYDRARKKLAEVLVCGERLVVAGGNYEICPLAENCRAGSGAGAQEGCAGMEENMKIAVTYADGEVFQHFGHCESFKLYEVENREVKSSEVVSAVGSGHGALAGFLKSHGVDTLVCGGIGGGARTALAEAGIVLYPGVQGNADDSVASLLSGSLQFDPDTVCSHHHEGGHACGADKHGCGGN